MGVVGTLFQERSLVIENISTGESINTYENWKIVSKSRLFVAPPAPKTSYLEQKSADGNIDVTEENTGRVVYENREGTWTFYLIDTEYFKDNELDEILWNRTYSTMLNFLQGKAVKVSMMEDPNFYWVGRLDVGTLEPESGRATIAINYNLEPYKYEIDEVEVDAGTVSTSKSVTCYGSPMDTSPTFDILSSEYILKPNEKIKRGEAMELLYNSATLLGTTQSISSGATMTFKDVLSTKSYYTPVLWGASRSYVSGYSTNVFAPENLIARGQFLNILYKIKGSPTASGTIPFTDVPTTSYCYKSVRWAFTNGYIVGDGDKHFYPNQPITRAQAIFMIWKVCGSPSTSSSVTFTDVTNGGDIVPWYYYAIVYAKGNGFISGHADGTFRPSDGITRAQFITILYRYAGTPFDNTYTNPFGDVSSTDYYYQAVCWAYANNGSQNIISGTSSDTFSPNRIMLRKEAIAVLYKYAMVYMSARVPYDEDLIAGDDPASDVAKTAYYYDAVCWAVHYGVTALDDGYRFNPEQNCSRAMACQFIYALELAAFGEVDFDDTPDRQYSETTTQTVAYDGTWSNGYYDTSSNQLVTDSGYKRSEYVSIAHSTYGDATYVEVDMPSGYTWRTHWFSSVTSSSQTLYGSTSWITSTGSTRTIQVPSGVTHFMVVVNATSSTNLSVTTSSYWEIGKLSTSDGETVSSPGTTTETLSLSWTVGGFNSQTGEYSSNQSYRLCDTSYYSLSNVTSMSITILNGREFYAQFYDSSKSYLGHSYTFGYDSSTSGSTTTVTIPSSASYVRFTISSTNTTPSTSEGSDLTVKVTKTTTTNSEYMYLDSFVKATKSGAELNSITVTIDTSSTYNARVFYYDSSSDFISASSLISSTSATLTPPSGTYYVRYSLMRQDGNAISTSECSHLTVTATHSASSSIDTSEIVINKLYEVTSGSSGEYVEDPYPDVTITHLYYINACKWAASNGVIDGRRARMDVTIVNDVYGTRTASIPSGTSDEPYLRIVNGLNTVTFAGNGTASFSYKRGSL